jgi:hypothetical protein
MSRYTNYIIKDGDKFLVVHGFDRPLQEYFIQVHAEEDEDTPLLWEGSRMTNRSNGDMMQFFNDWGVNDHYPGHCTHLALDLPF